MSKDSPKTMRNGSARKARPTMQLYCPRMLRTTGVREKVDAKENANTVQALSSVNTSKGLLSSYLEEGKNSELFWNSLNCMKGGKVSFEK